jgi:hypothetical protein
VISKVISVARWRIRLEKEMTKLVERRKVESEEEWGAVIG